MRGGAEREEAEDILPFMTWPQKSHRITSTTSRLFVSSSRHLKGPSGFKEWEAGRGRLRFSSGNGKVLEEHEGPEILLLL